MLKLNTIQGMDDKSRVLIEVVELLLDIKQSHAHLPLCNFPLLHV